MANLAFLGLGVMGAPMAGHLRAAGHTVAVWNRTAAKADPLKALGARVATSPADAARGAEALFVCVGDTPDVDQVLFGKDGAATGLASGSLVIDCSTISPDAEMSFATRFATQGVRYLDAPVTGGQKGAIEGTLSFMVGGDAANLERARPWLLAMGKKIIHCGPVGHGQRLKIVNQVVCALHLVAFSEGLAIARTLGIDLTVARDLLVSGAAKSWALEVYGEKIIKNDYAPGFSVKWQAKDVRIALDTVKKLGMKVPGLEMADGRLQDALAQGLGEEGVQAVYKLYGA
jgi:3-hydroxyisobutyrate dehydrogenase